MSVRRARVIVVLYYTISYKKDAVNNGLWYAVFAEKQCAVARKLQPPVISNQPTSSKHSVVSRSR